MAGYIVKVVAGRSGSSQRFTGTIPANRRTIVAQDETLRDGSSWEPDLQLTYTRAD